MARGSKKKDTSKQRRSVRHIEESGAKRGMSPKRGAEMAYATVNKEEAGAKRAGSGRGRKSSAVSISKAGRTTASRRKRGGRAARRS